MDLASASTLKALLAAHGLRPQHKLGQNFLTDRRILEAIADASGAGPNDLVLEIGPGLGSLTQQLAERAGRVLAIELDRNLVSLLSKTIRQSYANVEVVQGDAGRIDLQALLTERLSPGQRARVAANLPYYITTPLVMRLLEEGLPLDRIVVMVQKEVADRMISPPGSKEYGALSVAVQYYSEPQIALNVSKAAFLPPPEVESAVVVMQMRQHPPIEAPKEAFFRVVKAAFGQRRKTVQNALVAGLGLDKASVEAALAAAGVALQRRGETLSLEEFAAVARNLFGEEGNLR